MTHALTCTSANITTTPLNGYLHVIIPSQLIAFSGPSNLRDASAAWHDVAGHRYFGADFYANILGADFGVEMVVCCDCLETVPQDSWLADDVNYSQQTLEKDAA
jgi:hypothetical protein